MKSIVKKILVLLLTLTMVFAMTSCDIVLGILDVIIGMEDTPPEEEKVSVTVHPDEYWGNDPDNPYSNYYSGYNFTPASDEDKVWEVSSYEEADRVFDYVLANGIGEVTINFGSLVYDYPNFDVFFKEGYLPNSQKELEYITYYEYSYVGSAGTFKLYYDKDTASFNTPQTSMHTYENYKNGNMLLRDKFDGEATRPADFEDFPITKKNNGTMNVYNSEGLWWALEHDYLPTFPQKNTKAEAFYEEAKSILRKIINDDMTDYEKTLAIFEYLVDRVSYDYDAYNAPSNVAGAANNVCYFLEGIFEYNRAVCDGKSKAFVLLCRIEGIECLRDFGYSYSSKGEIIEGHAWNYVKIDGFWYMVDTTGGDSGVVFKEKGVRAEIVDYSYFLCNVNTYKSNYDGAVYEYSGVWDDELNENPYNKDISYTYYAECDLIDGKDFAINTYDELDFLIDELLLIIGDTAGTYTLKFNPNNTVTGSNVYEYVDTAIESDVEFEILDYTDQGFYMVIFTVK